jgi:hypothetical protein
VGRHAGRLGDGRRAVRQSAEHTHAEARIYNEELIERLVDCPNMHCSRGASTLDIFAVPQASMWISEQLWETSSRRSCEMPKKYSRNRTLRRAVYERADGVRAHRSSAPRGNSIAIEIRIQGRRNTDPGSTFHKLGTL